MAPITLLGNRLRQPSITTGTGDVTLASPAVGDFPLSDVYDDDVPLPYTIEARSSSGFVEASEVGLGHLEDSGATLVRDTVYRSTNGDALVDFDSPSLTVFVDVSAEALDQIIAHRALVTVVEYADEDHELTDDDCGKLVAMNSADPHTLTIPAGLKVGFSCVVVQRGEGTVTIAADGTTVNEVDGQFDLGGQYATVALSYIAEDEYIIAGRTA